MHQQLLPFALSLSQLPLLLTPGVAQGVSAQSMHACVHECMPNNRQAGCRTKAQSARIYIFLKPVFCSFDHTPIGPAAAAVVVGACLCCPECSTMLRQLLL
jgi:hypothetical protein